MPKKEKAIIILIIEDDIFLADLYRTKFELEGFTVYLAYDGEKGWEIAQKKNPDVILLDLILPKMGGFAVLENLKSDKKLKEIPVILLTNLSQKADVSKGLKMGAVKYLIKAHYTPTEIAEEIKKILE